MAYGKLNAFEARMILADLAFAERMSGIATLHPATYLPLVTEYIGKARLTLLRAVVADVDVDILTPEQAEPPKKVVILAEEDA